MKIEITRNTVCDRVPVFVGDIVTATDKAAKELIELKKAVPYKKEIEKKPVLKKEPEKEHVKVALSKEKGTKTNKEKV